MDLLVRIKKGEENDKWMPKDDEINCVGIVPFEEMRCVDGLEKKAVPMVAFVETYFDEDKDCEVMSEWRLPVDIIESVENLAFSYDPKDGALCDRLYEFFGDKFSSPSIKGLDDFRYPPNFIGKCFKTKKPIKPFRSDEECEVHFVVVDWDGKHFCIVETRRMLGEDGKSSFAIEKHYHSKGYMAEQLIRWYDRCSFDKFIEHYAEACKHIDIAVNDIGEILDKVKNK